MPETRSYPRRHSRVGSGAATASPAADSGAPQNIKKCCPGMFDQQNISQHLLLIQFYPPQYFVPMYIEYTERIVLHTIIFLNSHLTYLRFLPVSNIILLFDKN